MQKAYADGETASYHPSSMEGVNYPSSWLKQSIACHSEFTCNRKSTDAKQAFASPPWSMSVVTGIFQQLPTVCASVLNPPLYTRPLRNYVEWHVAGQCATFRSDSDIARSRSCGNCCTDQIAINNTETGRKSIERDAHCCGEPLSENGPDITDPAR